VLADSVSGRELAAAGVPKDVVIASQVDVSTTVPMLTSGAYQA
jgi:phosphosulfolactate phosphohydrolase-like enzyme